jgi:hypothetical protein
MKRNSDFSLTSTGHSTEDSSSDRTPVAWGDSSTETGVAACASSVFDYSTEAFVTINGDVANDCDDGLAHLSVLSDQTLNQIESTATSPTPTADNNIDNQHPSSNNNILHVPEVTNVNRKPSILISSRSDYVKKDLKIAILEPADSFRSSTIAKPKKRRIKSKTTIIAFLVTIVFILSFLPHLSLQVAKMIKKGFDYNLHGSALVAYNIFLRSYFINSAANPFIYGVFNIKFSAEVKRLWRKMCCKT